MTTPQPTRAAPGVASRGPLRAHREDAHRSALVRAIHAVERTWYGLRILPGPFRDLRRLVRYGIGGSCAAGAHLATTALLVELAAVEPVIASSLGFLVGTSVSYLVQRQWVFRSRRTHQAAVPRFLVVTATAWLINFTVLAIGTRVLDEHYAVVQLVALALIPLNNYVLNSLWTFRDATGPGGGPDPTELAVITETDDAH